MTMERLSSMSKNLTAQQLADELGVTRQLIYYHAKKLPAQEKIYDDDNTLVFSPSQQSEISSYMTDTIKDTKSEHQNKQINDVKANTLTTTEGEKARIIQTKQVSNKAANSLSAKVSNELSNDPTSGFTNNLTEGVSNEKEETLLNVESNDSQPKQTDDKEEVEVSVSNAPDTNRSESVKLYIQQVLRDQIGALYPVQQQEQIQESLFAELEEKNQQISTLHKLLDQQQQLALIAEQKHQKLLDTLGVEDIKQLEQIVKQAASKAEEHSDETPTTESTVNPNSQEKKSWFQRIFG